MILRMGIDIAVRAPHQASLADERGELIWSGHRFRTTAADLEQLWNRLPGGTDRRRGDGRDGADPQRLGTACGVVSPPGRPGRAGLRRTLSGPAGLLRQAHQERPAGLGAAGPAAAAASRGAAPRARAWARRPAAAGDQAALHAGQTSHRPAWPDWMPCWRSSARTGTPPSAPTWPTRPRCGSSPPVTPTLTRSAASGRARLARFLHRHSRGAWGEPRPTRSSPQHDAAARRCGTSELDFPDLPRTSPSRPAWRWP